MSTADSKPKTLIVIAWVFLLLSSGLPKIVLQEVFGYQVSFNVMSGIAGTVILLGLLMTFLWNTMRPLKSFFILFLVLVAVEWVVYTQVAELSVYKTWLANPSFDVYMLANQSLRLIVTLVLIAALFLLKKSRENFFLVKGNTRAEVEPVSLLGIKPGERWNTLGRNFALI